MLFILGPFFDWIFVVYGILTAGHRTWGGPRVDAAQADAVTSPRTAIEYAEETGDDLNVIPETFRPAVECQTLRRDIKTPGVSLQPSDRLEGRFKSRHLEQSQLLHTSSSERSLLDASEDSRDDLEGTTSPRSARPPRASVDSTKSRSTDAGQSIYLPRRAESLRSLASSDVELHENLSGQRSTARDPSKSRSHPPAAGSALTSLRLSQNSFDVPTRIRHRNSFGRQPSSSSVARNSVKTKVYRDQSFTQKQGQLVDTALDEVGTEERPSHSDVIEAIEADTTLVPMSKLADANRH
ncbi:MAG: hypothetical protein Q9162_006572 [Coniocarpon cinnabarinum]